MGGAKKPQVTGRKWIIEEPPHQKKWRCHLGASVARQSAVIVSHTGMNAYSTRSKTTIRTGFIIHVCSSVE
jgi:hypothetical protein